MKIYRRLLATIIGSLILVSLHCMQVFVWAQTTMSRTKKDISQMVQKDSKALLQDLLEGDDLKRMDASQALAPYVSEPEVKGALIEALEKSKNDVVRANAAKALSAEFAVDRTVAALLLKAFRRDSSDLVRMTIGQQLKEHVAALEVRTAMLDALKNDRNEAVMMSASEALIPYATEPEIQQVFIHAFETTVNPIVRANALRGLAEQTPPTRSIEAPMLRIFTTSKNSFERMTLAQAMSRYLDNPRVVEVLIEALKADRDDGVRMSASRTLKERIHSQEVYALMLERARRDPNKVVRANALDALSLRIKEKPELRSLFLSYLDDSSLMLQYYALKGLVELEDATLSARLVEKSKAIINSERKRRGNPQLILDTLAVLKRLDPKEAEKCLIELKHDGFQIP